MYKIYTHIRSPNYETRSPETKVEFLIIHYTGCNLENSLKILTHSETNHRVSAHYLVDETGEVYTLVNEQYRAWHAGESFWRGLTDINSRSVGIEIVNMGDQPFPPLQMESVLQLSREIITRHQISPSYVLGHSDIAPRRKADPGALFNWKWLAEHGVGLYPDIEKKGKKSEKNLDIKKAQCLLAQYGYAVPSSGVLDVETQAVMRAFQTHFWPESLKKGINSELIERLEYLIYLAS